MGGCSLVPLMFKYPVAFLDFHQGPRCGKSNPATWKASNIDTLQEKVEATLALYIILILPGIKQQELILI